MNVFTCTTRLYKDAEQKFLADGTGIVSFTGAVDAGFGKNKTTSWIKFSLFGKRGDALFPYLKDKTQVCVSGELANRKWQDKDGQDRFSLEVRVNELTLVGGKQGDGPQQEPSGSQQQSRQASPPSHEDVPFAPRKEY